MGHWRGSGSRWQRLSSYNSLCELELRSSSRRCKPASQPLIPARKSSIAVLSPRLELRTTRRNHLWRAVCHFGVWLCSDRWFAAEWIKLPSRFHQGLGRLASTTSLPGTYSVQISSWVSGRCSSATSLGCATRIRFRSRLNASAHTRNITVPPRISTQSRRSSSSCPKISLRTGK